MATETSKHLVLALTLAALPLLGATGCDKSGGTKAPGNVYADLGITRPAG